MLCSANQIVFFLNIYLHNHNENILDDDDTKAADGGNWPVFDFCNQFLQTSAELREATLDLLDRLAGENVVYAEIRFCPDLHTREGLTQVR